MPCPATRQYQQAAHWGPEGKEQTLPVRRERVRVEREEEPVVDRRVVPRERIDVDERHARRARPASATSVDDHSNGSKQEPTVAGRIAVTIVWGTALN
jgi:hypothetical protein